MGIDSITAHTNMGNATRGKKHKIQSGDGNIAMMEKQLTGNPLASQPYQ